jgi:GTP-binding protein
MVLIMDIRHPLTPLDRQMLAWFAPTKKAVHVLLTKSDKLTRQQGQKVLKTVLGFLRESYPQCSVQLFSSTSREGVEEASALLDAWFESGIGPETKVIGEAGVPGSNKRNMPENTERQK